MSITLLNRSKAVRVIQTHSLVPARLECIEQPPTSITEVAAACGPSARPLQGQSAASRSVIQIGRAFVLLEGVAPVNDDHLAGYIGRGFGREKRDSSSHFLRATGTADGSISTSDDFRAGGGRGFDPARSDRIHSNALPGKLERETASQPYYAGLSRTVCAFPRVADDWAGDRRNVHDTPIVRFQHERQNGFGDVESRLEVDGDAVIPVLFGKFGQR